MVGANSSVFVLASCPANLDAGQKRDRTSPNINPAIKIINAIILEWVISVNNFFHVLHVWFKYGLGTWSEQVNDYGLNEVYRRDLPTFPGPACIKPALKCLLSRSLTNPSWVHLRVLYGTHSALSLASVLRCNLRAHFRAHVTLI